MSKSVFKDYLSQAPSAQMKRSQFNRSHSLKTNVWDDFLAPIYLDEIYPGDTLNIGVGSFVRMNPTIAPIMDNVWQDILFFFVPTRLTWDNWQKFNGEQLTPGASTSYVVPQIETPVTTGWGLGTLADYFGLPILNDQIETVSALPFRAYNLIINEWFRDEQLTIPLLTPTGDGPDTPSTDINILCFQSAKRKDYFTSALLSPQKGPSIPIPQSTWDATIPDTTLPIVGYNVPFNDTAAGNNFIQVRNEAGVLKSLNSNDASSSYLEGASTTNGTGELKADASSLTATITETAEATINSLILAYQLQALYVRDNRAGTRYTEILRGHFGVISPDARLQRPEFLGSSSSRVNMHPLAQTSEEGTTPQGNLVANGTVIDNSLRVSKSFTEHGYVIGLVRYRGDVSYSQGINRFWSRQTRWDYYWPGLANIGEQAILRKELFADGTADDQDVFGYIPRYDELRYKQNYCTYNMRPDAPLTTAYWNLSQELDSTVTLSTAFIQSNTPFDRVLSVPAEPTFMCDFYFDEKWARVMPTYSNPGFTTRF